MRSRRAPSSLALSVLLVGPSSAAATAAASRLAGAGMRVAMIEGAPAAMAQMPGKAPEALLIHSGDSTEQAARLVSLLRHKFELPILLLTEIEDESRLQGISAGADDVVSPAVSGARMASYISAARDRSELPAPQRPKVVTLSPLAQVDFANGTLTSGERQISLRPAEYRLLYHLVHGNGKAMSTRTLLGKVWGRRHRQESEHLNLYISYLRGYLEPDPRQPRHLLGDSATGFRFQAG
jgi:DNA-binding response OmpR family regulator